ncbi:MAG TPA: ABC transporter ATP-binding protein [Aggregatilineales bacterium]|nr:ABC transporter ATP-binding protein [Aggregatilineales bacterium]
MIEAEALTKEFTGFRAVDEISLKVEAGSVFALLGPNGAGKTTTVRMLTSILEPTSGWARVAGFDVVKQSSEVRASVGVLTEQHGLYERMKGLDYLAFFGRVYNLPADRIRRRSLELLTRFGLEEAAEWRLATYSKGMKQKLALVRAMLHNPPILLLDEPTSAMDPQSAKQVRDALIELKRDQRTIVLTTHNLVEAQLLADRIGVIRRGRLIAQGTFTELALRFVGNPTIRVEFAHSINGAAKELNGMTGVEVVRTDERSLEYRTDNPTAINPAVLRKLLGVGMEVVALGQTQQTLEDVYLQIVAEDEGLEHSQKAG